MVLGSPCDRVWLQGWLAWLVLSELSSPAKDRSCTTPLHHYLCKFACFPHLCGSTNNAPGKAEHLSLGQHPQTPPQPKKCHVHSFRTRTINYNIVSCQDNDQIHSAWCMSTPHLLCLAQHHSRCPKVPRSHHTCFTPPGAPYLLEDPARFQPTSERMSTQSIIHTGDTHHIHKPRYIVGFVQVSLNITCHPPVSCLGLFCSLWGEGAGDRLAPSSNVTVFPDS